MIKKINGLVILTTITALSLLGACGSEENSSEVQANEGRQDYSPEDFKKISDGFEEYSVWIETSNTPSRESSIRALFVFSDENLTSYGNINDEDKLTLEEVNELTDDELIKQVEKHATRISEGEYTLDITLDEFGQNTKEISLILEEDYNHIITYDLKSLYWESGLSSEVEYIASLEEKGDQFEVNNEDITFTSIEDEPKNLLTINGGMISQRIFDTTYSGLSIGEQTALLSRVDEGFIGFVIDSPDTTNNRVTIEGK
ncbi:MULTISPECIES: hypothetical protein [Bacillaceae]|uniref:Lipoprotein n=1 Tax=Alkalicoccobacillus plakortidis TaxID=444060 RepID=A0A9D5I249_9BACI|nr:MULTISPECIES: hypothetical protein [Bacillaceae]KQL58355.1 hypothetical protein AN965_03400 [Alkalicoccobacillus plakortidis]RQW22921.1 hypothetical protein EH196_03665 [Bacillus sp. C1-1]